MNHQRAKRQFTGEMLIIIAAFSLVAGVLIVMLDDGDDVNDDMVEPISSSDLKGYYIEQNFNGLTAGAPPSIPGWVTGGNVNIRNTQDAIRGNQLAFESRGSHVNITIPNNLDTYDNRDRFVINMDAKINILHNTNYDYSPDWKADESLYVRLYDDTGALQGKAAINMMSTDDNDAGMTRNYIASFQDDVTYDPVAVTCSMVSTNTIDIKWTVLGPESAMESSNLGFYYAIYVRRESAVPGSDLINNVVKPVYVMGSSDFLSTTNKNRIRAGYLEYLYSLPSSSNYYGDWYIGIIPGYTSIGLLPEWGKWTFINKPGGTGDGSNLGSLALPIIGTDGPASLGTYDDFEFGFVRAGYVTEAVGNDNIGPTSPLYNSILDENENIDRGNGYSLLSSTMKRVQFTVLYDPIIYRKMSAGVDGKFPTNNFVFSDSVARKRIAMISIGTDPEQSRTSRVDHSTFNPAYTSINPAVYIDDLEIGYPSSPVIGQVLAIDFTGNGSTRKYLDGGINTYDIRCVVPSGSTKTVRIIADVTDLDKFFSNYLADVTITIGGTAYAMVRSDALNDTAARYLFDYQVVDGDTSFKSATITATHKIHAATTTKSFKFRAFSFNMGFGSWSIQEGRFSTTATVAVPATGFNLPVQQSFMLSINGHPSTAPREALPIAYSTSISQYNLPINNVKAIHDVNILNSGTARTVTRTYNTETASYNLPCDGVTLITGVQVHNPGIERYKTWTFTTGTLEYSFTHAGVAVAGVRMESTNGTIDPLYYQRFDGTPYDKIVFDKNRLSNGQVFTVYYKIENPVPVSTYTLVDALPYDKIQFNSLVMPTGEIFDVYYKLESPVIPSKYSLVQGTPHDKIQFSGTPMPSGESFVVSYTIDTVAPLQGSFSTSGGVLYGTYFIDLDLEGMPLTLPPTNPESQVITYDDTISTYDLPGDNVDAIIAIYAQNGTLIDGSRYYFVQSIPNDQVTFIGTPLVDGESFFIVYQVENLYGPDSVIDLVFNYDVIDVTQIAPVTTSLIGTRQVMASTSPSIYISVPGVIGQIVTEDAVQPGTESFSVEAVVNDPAGTVGSGDVIFSMTRNGIDEFSGTMADFGPLYSISVPVTSITGTSGSLHVLRAWIDGSGSSIVVEDEMTIEIQYGLPLFTIASPQSSSNYLQSTGINIIIDVGNDGPLGIVMKSMIIDIDAVDDAITDPMEIPVSIPDVMVAFTDNGVNIWKLVTSVIPSSLSPGSYNLIMTAKDAAGFVHVEETTFQISAYTPIVTATVSTTPLQDPASILSGTVDIAVDAYANSATITVTAIGYRIFKWTPSPSPGSWSATTSYITFWTGSSFHPVQSILLPSSSFDGKYYVAIRVTTTSGAYDFIAYLPGTTTKEFTVTQVDPVFSFTGDNPKNGGTYVTEANVRFLGSITDANGDLDTGSITYNINSGEFTGSITLNSSSEFDFTIPVASFTLSTNSIVIKYKDLRMATLATSMPRIFYVDTSAPQMTATVKNLTGGILPYYTGGDVLNISAVITDSVGIIATNFTVVNKASTSLTVYQKIFAVTGSPLVYRPTDVLFINSIASYAPEGQRTEFRITWKIENVNNRLTITVSNFVIDKRTPIVAFTTAPIQISTGTRHVIAAVIPPTTLSLYSVTCKLTGSNGIIYFTRAAVYEGGTAYSVDVNYSELSKDVTSYQLCITATASNGYSTSSCLGVTATFYIPVLSTGVAGSIAVPVDTTGVVINATVTDGNDDIDVVSMTYVRRDYSGETMTMTMTPGSGNLYTGLLDFGDNYGSWDVRVTANDSKGFETVASFIAYRVPPVFNVAYYIAEPLSNQLAESTLNITIVIVDGLETVVAVEYRIPDLDPGWIVMTNFYSDEGAQTLNFVATANTSTLAIGEHVMEARVLVFSEYSEIRSILFYKTPPVSELEPPVLATASASGYSVSLSWSTVDNATSYNVFRSTSPIIDPETNPVLVTVTGTTYIDTVPSNGTYYYAVVAVNDDGRSELSNTISITVAVAPPAPTFLEWLVQQFEAIIAFIVALFAGIFGTVTVRAKRRNLGNGISTSLSCLANPKQDKCTA